MDAQEKILQIRVDSAQAIQMMSDYTTKVKELKAEEKKLKEQIDDLDKTDANYAQTLDKLQKELIKTKEEEKAYSQQVSQLSKTIQDQLKIEDEQLKTQAKENGSLKDLRAELSRATKEYDSLSRAEREGAKGDEMLQHIVELTNEIKEAEENTKRFYRNVGNYPDVRPLSAQLNEIIQRMQKLKLEGKDNTEEFKNLSQQAGAMKDAISDTSKVVANLGSDTGTLAALQQSITSVTSVMSLLTATLATDSAEGEKNSQIMKTLKTLLAALSVATALQTNLQKQSALMLGVQTIQTKAAAAATALQTKNTWLAVAAQKVLNAVANANPYVLLATAVISVVGALLAFSSGTKEAAEQQKLLNEAEKTHLDYLDKHFQYLTHGQVDFIKQKERELELAKEEGRSLEEIRDLEDKIMTNKKTLINLSKGYYKDEINNLEANYTKLETLNTKYDEIKKAKAAGMTDVTFGLGYYAGGKRYNMKVDDALEFIEGVREGLEKQIETAVKINDQAAELENEEKIRAERRKKQDESTRKAELNTLRNAEDAKNALIQDSYDREEAQRKTAITRSIADIQYQLDNEKNLTVEQKKALNEQIKSLETQLDNELKQIEKKRQSDLLAIQQQTQETLISLLNDGVEKETEIENTRYEKQRTTLQAKLDTEKKAHGEETELYKAYAAQMEVIEAEHKDKLDKISLAGRQKEIEQTMQTMQMKLDLIKNDLEAEYNLRKQMLYKQLDLELSKTEYTEEQKELIRKKYAQDVIELEQQKQLALEEQTNLEWSNRIEAAKLMYGEYLDSTLESMQLEMDQAHEHMKNLHRLEGESDEEFKARMLQAQSDYLKKKKQMADAEIAIGKATATATAEFAGQLSDLLETVGKDNKEALMLSKTLALAEVAIKQGVAIAEAVAESAAGDPYTYAIRVAAAIASTVTAMVKAISSINSAKFSKGTGYVTYPGTKESDGDVVPALLTPGEAVATVKANKMFPGLVQAMNDVAAGVSTPARVFNSSNVVNNYSSQSTLNEIAENTEKRLVVSVEEIHRVEDNVEAIENLSTL